MLEKSMIEKLMKAGVSADVILSLIMDEEKQPEPEKKPEQQTPTPEPEKKPEQPAPAALPQGDAILAAIEKLTGAVNRVVERERQLRETLVTSGGIDLEDSICRSLGLLRYAKKMSSKEFLKLWSDVKFGVESGVIKELDGINLSKLLVAAMPAHILKKYPETATSSVRDAKRA